MAAWWFEDEMKKILIISATTRNNLALARQLGTLINKLDARFKVLSLEDFALPLFTPSAKIDSSVVEQLAGTFQAHDGFLFCAPEYNGGVPPIMSNAIAWISVTTDNWRAAFNGKCAQLASHSNGSATRFFSAFRSQLEYLGVLVMPRVISRTNNSDLKLDSVERILAHFISHV
ncbi:MAG: NADPH-dependent FMN reductase [Fidelibacterota bacterium]